MPDDYASIQKGVDAARQGDTVRVAAGTFFESVSMKEGVIMEGGWSNDFLHRDPSTQVTEINAIKTGGWVVFGADNAILDGFTIINGSLSNIEGATSGAGIHCRSTSPIIRNNIIRNNAPGGIYCKNSDATISDNIIYENEKAGVYVESDCDLKIYSNIIRDNHMSGIGSGSLPISNLDVRNNIIHHNMIAGINAISATGTFYNNIIYENAKAGIRFNMMPMKIINNTIVANHWSGVVGVDFSAIPVIKNNIICYNRKGGIRLKEAGYSYNLLNGNNSEKVTHPKYIWSVRRQFSGYQDEITYSKRFNIIADPLFVDPAAHDFHLRPDSPAINAGDPAISFNDRFLPKFPGARRNDIGAYGGPFADKISGNIHAHQIIAKPTPTKTVSPQPTKITPVTNQPPTVKIDAIRKKIKTGDKVTFSIYDSNDPEDEPLTYSWELSFKPLSSHTSLTKRTSLHPTLKMDVPGCYTIEITANDGELDSAPDCKIFCTDQQARFGVRYVPDQYPTIQAAIDSSLDDDTIIVQKGVYNENVIVDVSVNLIGVDWPVINGGTKKNGRETMLIAGLGKHAGLIQGFVITGGGMAPMGHGIKIWNSAPEIFNNKITQNGYVGIGIHGDEKLTEATLIHDNFIHDNLVGVGNGLGCRGHVYRNYIYHNIIAGVGIKGHAGPSITGNKIYGNFVGIGSREIAFPKIDRNEIYDNTWGIAISQGNPSAPLEPKQLMITDNFVSRNRQGGIFISSLNPTPIIISNNTVDSNNLKSRKTDRIGGIIIGYPHQAPPTIFLKNNLLNNNKNFNFQEYSQATQNSIDGP